VHIKEVSFFPEKFPAVEDYPFNMEIFKLTGSIDFNSPVTFFIGENGAGKSTLLKAIALKCNIPIWKNSDRLPFHNNRHAEELYRYIEVKWAGEAVPGSYFASEIFNNFAQILDDWARADPGMLRYFGGQSLVSKSHGQSHMSYFRSRYKIKGLYLLDEPENALSPKTQLEFLKIIKEMGQAGHAQFIIATHSPILLALPGVDIYSFDYIPVMRVEYEDTDYYRIYKNFLDDRNKYLEKT
jgi:predicted ATPase